jgi:hypothetical protein
MAVTLWKPTTESEREWLDLFEDFLDSGGTFEQISTVIGAHRTPDPTATLTRLLDAETDPWLRYGLQVALDVRSGAAGG